MQVQHVYLGSFSGPRTGRVGNAAPIRREREAPELHSRSSDFPQDAPAAMQNLAVVSISGYDELKRDVGFLGTIAGNPNIAATAEAMITMLTQGQGLAGLDTTKPFGAVV